MTKVSFLLLIILGTTISFVQDKSYKPKYWTIVDSVKGEELLQQCSRGIPQNIQGYWTLDVADIYQIEKNYLKILDMRAEDCCLLGGKINRIEKFAFQYVGVKIDGKRYVYINAFQVDKEADLEYFYPNWKTNPIIACDGGRSFWGVLFDLETFVFSHLAINGSA